MSNRRRATGIGADGQLSVPRIFETPLGISIPALTASVAEIPRGLSPGVVHLRPRRPPRPRSSGADSSIDQWSHISKFRVEVPWPCPRVAAVEPCCFLPASTGTSISVCRRHWIKNQPLSAAELESDQLISEVSYGDEAALPRLLERKSNPVTPRCRGARAPT